MNKEQVILSVGLPFEQELEISPKPADYWSCWDPDPSHHQSTSLSLSVHSLGTGIGILTQRKCQKEGQGQTPNGWEQNLNRDPSPMTNTQGGHQIWGHKSIHGLWTLYYNIYNTMLCMVPDLKASLGFSSWNKCWIKNWQLVKIFDFLVRLCPWSYLLHMLRCSYCLLVTPESEILDSKGGIKI